MRGFGGNTDNPADGPGTGNPLDKSPRWPSKETKFIVSLSALGLIVFLAVATLAPFKDKLFSYLYPKPKSHAQEIKQDQKPPKPEYVQGEVLVKFRIQTNLEVKQERKNQGIDLDKGPVTVPDLEEKSVPEAIKKIHQKQKIKEIEKVFKGAKSPKEELNKFKQKFAKEISEGKRKINEEELLKIDLSRTYKLAFEVKETPVAQIIQELSQNPEVEYAEPNFIFRTQQKSPKKQKPSPTPTPSPTPIPTPTPTPLPCTLTSAAWSSATALEGSSVGLDAAGTSCAGKTVSFEVRRFGSTPLDDIPANIQPSPIVLNAFGQGAGSWIAEYNPLIPGTDPDYYFKATVSGGNTVDNKTALLTVTQAPIPTPLPTPTPTASPMPAPILPWPNDPYYLDHYPDQVSSRDPTWNPPHDYQWNIRKTNSSENWKTDTSSIIVAVIDTGVDVTHPELGNVWVNTAEITGDGIDNDNNGCVDDINGCAFIWGSLINTGNVTDTDNHGTHVAGVISAKTNNAIGLSGVTSNTKIMAVKVFADNGYTTGDYIAAGVRYAVNNGARAMNMSIGGSYSQVFKDALDYATSFNVISVVAAGNGNMYSPSHFPASYKPAITVGGVDEELNKMQYAGYGPNIDVSAPGGGKPCMYFDKPSYCSNILSLKSSQNSNDPDLIVNEKYLRLSGTSMATPHVVGIIALLLAKNPQFTLADVENYIRFNSIDPQGKGHNEKTGWGVINSAGTNFVSPTNIDFVTNYPAENSLIGKKFNVAGLIKADNFDHFEVSYKKQGSASWSILGVELANSGRSPVAEVGSNTISKVATITLPDNSPLGVYEIKVSLFLTNGKSLNSTKTVNFLQKLGTQWLFTEDEDVSNPYYFTQNAKILLADINNDGNKEIILYSYGNYDKQTLSVFDHNYNPLWKVDSKGEIVVGELDSRNPGKEIALQVPSTYTYQNSNIYIYSSSGALINDMTLNLYVDASKNLMALDTNNDGKDELYTLDASNLRVYEQNSSNQFIEKWRYQTNGSSYDHVYPAAGDINGDGQKEIIVLNSGNKLEALNNQGQLIASYTWAGSYPIDRMILVDMDLDKKEEIVFHIQWGNTKMIKFENNTFKEVWSYNNSNNIQSLSAGDFNGDGYPEVHVQVNNTSNEAIIDRNGLLIYNSWSPIYWAGDMSGGAVLADKDGNNKTEIFHAGDVSVDYRYYLNVREFDDSSKQMIYTESDWKAIFPQWSLLNINYTYGYKPNNLSLALDDLDNNNKLDLVIAGVGIIEYDTKGKIYWPSRYHDSGRTNSYNYSLPIPTPIPTPLPTSTPTPTPSPSCMPRPSCLDANPPCTIIEPPEGWCGATNG